MSFEALAKEETKDCVNYAGNFIKSQGYFLKRYRLTLNISSAINFAMVKERQPIATAKEARNTSETVNGPQLIVQRRKLLGWSQARLARETGLSQGYLCQIELGELVNAPSYKSIIGIAKALGIGINFWEEGLNDKKVFLTHQACVINEFIQLPDTTPVRIALLTYVKLAIPEMEGTNVTYIDHFPTYTRIGDKIADLREKIGYTQKQVWASTEISQGYYSQLEGREGRKKGDKYKVDSPKIEILESIASVLNTNIYDLLDLTEIEYPELVVRVDRFFRSSQVPPEKKIKAWTTTSSILEQSGDSLLFPPQTPTTPTE